MARAKKQAQHLDADDSAASRSTRTPSPSASRTRSPPSPESERPIGPLSIVVQTTSQDTVKVNTANSTELKNACDDAVKRYLSRPELFKQIHLHTDVRLGLGWLSVFVAAGTALYGYKVDFEQSKPVVSIGLVVYIFLTVLQTLYAYFVESNTIFVGKRKSFSKRIITERIHLNSSTTLLTKGRTKATAPYSSFFDEEGVMDQDAFGRWVGELNQDSKTSKIN
ncbi:microsomal signal peptidase 25 kDa subunit-domain-containing protein [Pholiota molesta]|nr:microsomal signal peptidase 25 kDa subunit-domain-containing protein [Pholiota molesta]